MAKEPLVVVVILKFPPASVCTPFFVFWSTTETASTGFPCSFVTFPETWIVLSGLTWAMETPVSTYSNITQTNVHFKCLLFLRINKRFDDCCLGFRKYI